MLLELNGLLEKLDSTTFNHSIRVFEICKEIEQFYGYNNNDLSIAGLYHDIGKLYISSKILDKKGRLSFLERDLINFHSYIGYQILKDYDVSEDVCRIVLYHHGPYPGMIKFIEPYDNNEIYDRAKMLRSIDCFEALTSDRAYHRGYFAKQALDIMLNEEGHHKKFIDYLVDKTEHSPFDSDSKIFRCFGRVDIESIGRLLDKESVV